MRLLLPDGTPAEDGEQGEIVVKLPEDGSRPAGLFKEYYRDPELTAYATRGGYYHTGDLAWRDEDGYLWYVGRVDDVIKSSGYRIGPFEVESALMTHPAVVECAITGVPDEIRGQVVKATVVLAPDWKRRAGEELVKELQAGHGSIQVSACDRICRRAAQDHLRQDPACGDTPARRFWRDAGDVKIPLFELKTTNYLRGLWIL